MNEEITTHHWDEPSAAQLADGILAIHMAHHSYFKNGVMFEYFQACPYRHAYLLRRWQRGGDLPTWVKFHRR